MTNLLFLLAICAMIVWVAKINYDLAKLRGIQKNHEHERKQLIERAERYQRIIEKVERIQVQSKQRMENFFKRVDDTSTAHDINKLLNEAFGSLVNRQDSDSL